MQKKNEDEQVQRRQLCFRLHLREFEIHESRTGKEMKSGSAPTSASSQNRITRTTFTLLSETTPKKNILINDLQDIVHQEIKGGNPLKERK